MQWRTTNNYKTYIEMVLVLFIFLIVEFRWIPGGQVGFHCNDPALSYPFTGDTINMKWLFGTTLVLPLVMVSLKTAYCPLISNTTKVILDEFDFFMSFAKRCRFVVNSVESRGRILIMSKP